jgi:hypothetical protein
MNGELLPIDPTAPRPGVKLYMLRRLDPVVRDALAKRGLSLTGFAMPEIADRNRAREFGGPASVSFPEIVTEIRSMREQQAYRDAHPSAYALGLRDYWRIQRLSSFRQDPDRMSQVFCVPEARFVGALIDVLLKHPAARR